MSSGSSLHPSPSSTYAHFSPSTAGGGAGDSGERAGDTGTSSNSFSSAWTCVPFFLEDADRAIDRRYAARAESELERPWLACKSRLSSSAAARILSVLATPSYLITELEQRVKGARITPASPGTNDCRVQKRKRQHETEITGRVTEKKIRSEKAAGLSGRTRQPSGRRVLGASQRRVIVAAGPLVAVLIRAEGLLNEKGHNNTEQ